MKIKELKELPQWINWNYQLKGNKKTKVPIAYNGATTGTNEEYKHTWTTHDRLSTKYDGVGVVFTNGLCGIDIDNKDLDDPIVKDIIETMNTYTEYSPSKTGFHLLFTVDINKIPTYINEKGQLKLENKYYQKNPYNQVECYIDGITNRFFTFTDNSINNNDICERTEELLIILDKYMLRDTKTKNDISQSKTDEEIIQAIRNSKQNDRFTMLYDLGDTSYYDGDKSSADMGLCCILAYYTKNFEQIDRIFKTSKLYRDKWEREDYKYSTITKAIDLQTINKSFIDNGKFLSQEFAQFLKDRYNIIKINGQLHIYKDGVYIHDNEEIEALMLKHIPNISSTRRNETLKILRLLNLEGKKESSSQYIAFENGIYDLESNKLISYDPNIIIINKIPWNYVENSYNSNANDVLNAWANNDIEVRNLLEEIIGMCMFRSNEIPSCFIIVGDKSNGKSKFIHLLQFMLGEKNYSSVSLEDIETRFKNADLYGKLANLGDDIGDRYIAGTEMFKKLVTGETVQCERKGQDPFTFKNNSKLIFNANTIPRIKDDTGAVIEKRIIIVPFIADFSGKKGDPFLDSKMNRADFMEYVISIGIKAIKRVIANKGFSKCKATDIAKQNYMFDNDPVLQFIEEHGKDNIQYHDAKDILRDYRFFCERNGFKSDTAQTLNRGIKKHLGYIKVKTNETQNGKQRTLYVYR